VGTQDLYSSEAAGLLWCPYMFTDGVVDRMRSDIYVVEWEEGRPVQGGGVMIMIMRMNSSHPPPLPTLEGEPVD